jgi:hypothetical protein
MQNDGIQLRPIAWPSFDCPSPRAVVLLDTLLSLELSFSESTYMMSLLGMSGQHTTKYMADTFMLRGYTFTGVFDRGKNIVHQFTLAVVLSVVHLDGAINRPDHLQLPWPSWAGQTFVFNCMSSIIIQWEIAWPSFCHEAIIECRSVGTLFGISGWYFQHWLSLLLLSEYCVGEAAINSNLWMIVVVDSSVNTLLDNILGWYSVVLKKGIADHNCCHTSGVSTVISGPSVICTSYVSWASLYDETMLGVPCEYGGQACTNRCNYGSTATIVMGSRWLFVLGL